MNEFSLQEVLRRLEIKELNPMQVQAAEAFTRNEDVILLAPTGSGKTLAFLLPLARLIKPGTGRVEALIVCPTRELALQTESVFKKMGTGLRAASVYGGHDMQAEIQGLTDPPPVLIGTPGRLADHIRRGTLRTEHIKILVLDEFDKSLEAGFEDEMTLIREALPAVRKQMLTSATDMEILPEFTGIHDPVRISFLGGTKHDLSVLIAESPGKDKLDTLACMVLHFKGKPAIVFCNHRESVMRAGALLMQKDIPSALYHGALQQYERDLALFRFRSGCEHLLVTTDLASRGLDIPFVEYVVHYHLPQTQEVFIHRNGRTARMGASGTAVCILAPEERLPEFAGSVTERMLLPEAVGKPVLPSWTAFVLEAGKKDKINKVDIAGFFLRKGGLKSDDLGLIEVRDHYAFVAVRSRLASRVLGLLRDEKIKNRKIRIRLVPPGC